MPNKRKKTKDQLNAWVQKKLKEDIKKLASYENIPVSSMVERLLREQVDIYKTRRPG